MLELVHGVDLLLELLRVQLLVRLLNQLLVDCILVLVLPHLLRLCKSAPVLLHDPEHLRPLLLWLGLD